MMEGIVGLGELWMLLVILLLISLVVRTRGELSRLRPRAVGFAGN